MGKPKVKAVVKNGAVIYCRVSTIEQAENFSLETQEKTCKAYCGSKGLKIQRVFTEAESAKSTKRPQFQAMLKYCLDNRSTVGVVVVYAVSRFSRNVADYHNTKALLARASITLQSATEVFEPDNPFGQFFETLMSAHAQLDNDLRSARTIDGMQAALAAGRWVHRAPLGFRVSETAGTDSNLIHDPERADLVAKAFEMFGSTSGWTKAEVLESVTALGLRTVGGNELTPQSLDNMLRNPLYAGRIVLARWGINATGKVPPIVTEELFNRVQAKLNGGKQESPSGHTAENPEFPLRVFVRCAGCDAGLTGSFATGRKGVKYPYYTCRTKGCRAVKFRRDDLHALFADLLRSCRPDPAFAKLFKAVLADVQKERSNLATRIIADIDRQLAQLQVKRDRLLDFYLAEKLSKEAYDDQTTKVGTALQELTYRRAELAEKQPDVADLVDFSEWFLSNVATLWESGALPERRRLQEVVFPGGLTVTSEGFGTAASSLFFKQLEQSEGGEKEMASPAGFEPALSP